MRIHYLQHVPFEDLANIEPWARTRGHTLTRSALFAGEALPELDAFDWLIVMGGPMGVHDVQEHVWLTGEKALLRTAIDAGKAVLGVCLGAQLIADVLGAAVTRNTHKEIGWFPVRLTGAAASSSLLAGLPDAFQAFHWHGDTFGVPDGAVHVAESEACRHQAFVYGGRVIGLQFHLETSEASADRLIAHCPEDIVDGRFVQSIDAIRAGYVNIDGANALMARLLDNIEGAMS